MSEPVAPELYSFTTRLQLLLPPLLSAQRSSWEQGICAQAMLECHRFLHGAGISPNSLCLSYDFVQWLYALAHDSLVRQGPDGRLSVLLNGDGTSDLGALDPACIGETLYYLCALEAHSMTFFPPPRGGHSGSLMEGVENMLSYVMDECPRGLTGSEGSTIIRGQLLSHRTDTTEIWSDTIYMLPPFLAAAAAFRTLPLSHPVSRDLPHNYAPRDLLEMSLQQVILAADALQSPSGEWSHMYNIGARCFKRRAHWGVGNGWVCCGIVRLISTLVVPTTLPRAPSVDLAALGLQPSPKNGGGKQGDDEDDEASALLPLLRRVYEILQRTLRASLAHALARPAELFPNDLSDPDSFPETNLAQMLAYTLYRLADLHAHCAPFRALQLGGVDDYEGAAGEGARDGYNRAEVDGWVTRAHALRAAAVGMTDRWGFVRDVCGSPSFDGPGTAAEGQAWGVLMEVACAQYMWHKRQTMLGVGATGAGASPPSL
ncbi:hypothetical protein C2E23DRAFT_720009 [Lenzites betulinus]|nr:hypothetical protein C2E23DRAFT_720009 [Lenzites betulinus]